ncbi:hypothetical protein [uncultured Subdoligranulum sp.]|uniref:hypothetical protein n=1 Tax=uncultured Subdoligranulum sp. TaxID=512298 RepID=UPI00261CAC1C|nr:hypothetical protein [uncultured Subdoligranulum sp.]
MNESKNHATMLYKTAPAVASLNHVNGFDPLKLLRRTHSPQTGEPVLKLDLRYKRLWFRLACPKGRLRLNALRITEQIAIFEAKVYRNMEDSEPISSYIAECSRDTTPGGLYVEAAQSEALNTALSNAGFGIQFADVAGGEDVYGSEIPADATPLILDVVPAGPEQEATVAQEKAPACEHVQAEKAAEPEAVPEPVSPPEESAEVAEMPEPQEKTAQEVSVQERPSVPPEETRAVPVTAELAPVAATEPQAAPQEEEEPAAALPYTKDTPVEEIVAQMSYDDAANILVDVGTCKGWTMAQVADRRPPSLRWYLYGYQGDNNVLRAAAKIMLDHLTLPKAG